MAIPQIIGSQPAPISGTVTGRTERPNLVTHMRGGPPHSRIPAFRVGLRFLPLVASASIFIPFLSACQPYPPSPPPTTASVTVNAMAPSVAGALCTGDFTWSYELVSAAGSTGTTGTFTHTRSYRFPSSGSQCLYQDSAVGLRPGTWQISVLNLTCRVSLPATVGNSVLNMNNCQVA